LNVVGQAANPAVGSFGVVASGYGNTVTGAYGFIGNGSGHSVAADYGFVGGGQGGTVSGTHGVVAGGYGNEVLGSVGAVGGGRDNTARSAENVIAGGRANTTDGFNSAVGGGYLNSATGSYAVVPGGYANSAGGLSAVVGGGSQNQAGGDYSTVAGGGANVVLSPLGFIGGGARNTVTNGLGSGVVVGGDDNHNNSDLGVIVGGRENTAEGAENAIVGGRGNTVGGFNSFVGGGYLNSATGSYAVVPGGLRNSASGDYSLAAGRRAAAAHAGAMVLADSQDADFASTQGDTLIVRMAGGVAINRTNQLGAGALTVRSLYPGGYGGMYVEGVGASSVPFYGYAMDGTIKAWHQYTDGAAASQKVWMAVVGGATPLLARGDNSVAVTGNLSKAGGYLEIDHPLDPANKYLYHSFVESPDMMNIYNGNVVTDASGYATVVLPEWFESLNREFRYQLTVVDDGEAGGDFVLARVVRKVQGNRFVIKTSAPNTEVSWQVTGVRQDAWAEAHRIPTEVEKSGAERGRYLHPELFGRPAEEGIRAAAPQESSPRP
jgi:hypothetical protein